MNTSNATLHCGRGLRQARGQRGITLIIALIALVIMSMAGVLMLRSLGSGLGIAGNVAFKEGATMGADRGVEAARAWLLVAANDKDTTDLSARPGYFSTWNGGMTGTDTEFDPFAFDWGTAANRNVLAELNGNTVQYVIHRLCRNDGSASASGQVCVTSESANQFKASNSTLPVTRVPHFRITSRVLGPRNTVSFIQVIVY